MPTKLSWPTLVTLVVTGSLAPFLAQHGFTLTPDQTIWLTSFLVAGPTAVVHWLHDFFAKNLAKTAIQPNTTGTKLSSLAAVFLPTALLLGATSLQLGGCATQPTVQQQAGIAAAVDIATSFAVQRGSADPAAWKARAANFKSIAMTLQGTNSTAPTTLATLSADLQPLIAKLGPADVLAANALVAALTPYLQQQISANQTVANTQTVVGIVLQDIINACAAYGA